MIAFGDVPEITTLPLPSTIGTPPVMLKSHLPVANALPSIVIALLIYEYHPKLVSTKYKRNFTVYNKNRIETILFSIYKPFSQTH